VSCPENAHCLDGKCECDDGYQAQQKKRRTDQLVCVSSDPCANMNCPQYSHCRQGDCICDDGYQDSNNQKKRTNPVCVPINDGAVQDYDENGKKGDANAAPSLQASLVLAVLTSALTTCMIAAFQCF